MKLQKVLTLNFATAFFFASSFSPFLVVSAINRNNVSSAKQIHEGASKIMGSIVVTNNSDDIVGYAKSQGLKPTQIIEKKNNRPALVSLAELPDNPKVQALARQKNVEVAPNYAYQAAMTPNDPRYGEQWNLSKISAPQAWDVATGRSSVSVAVLDSGVLFSQTINGTVYDQPDMDDSRKWINAGETGMTQDGDACWDLVAGSESKQTNNCDDDSNGYIDDWQAWDFMGGYRGTDASCPNHNSSSEYESSNDPTLVLQDNDPQPYSCDSPSSPNVLNKNHYDGSTCSAFTSACFVGHGTMVASVIAAETNNSTLIAGLDHQAKIMNVRVLDGYGWGSTDRLVGGLYYAADNGADVINMSLGNNCNDESFSDSIIEAALKNAADKGVVMVAASGNSNLSTVCYPASSPYVMAIGATDSNDNRQSYSSYSNKLDVVAPAGVPVANAPSAQINSNYYASAYGTSLSTPHVAGLAALIKGIIPGLSREQTEDMIRDNTDKVPSMNGYYFNPEYGYGRVNAYKAVVSAKNAAYGNIRLITCENKNYIIERNIRRKRLINDEAMQQWNLTSLYFNDNDRGCDYPAYSLALDRVVRSRNTKKVYLVENEKAQWLHSKEAANSWGLGNYETQTYPQFDGKSIHFLNVVRELPLHKPNIGSSNIRIFKCGNQKYMVERFIRRKRQLSTYAVDSWSIKNAYFAPNDRGCGYPTYDLELNKVIRSRTTGKEYMVYRGVVYKIHSKEAAVSWGIEEDYETQTYPQFDGKSIHFLPVEYELPPVE